MPKIFLAFPLNGFCKMVFWILDFWILDFWILDFWISVPINRVLLKIARKIKWK